MLSDSSMFLLIGNRSELSRMQFANPRDAVVELSSCFLNVFNLDRVDPVETTLCNALPTSTNLIEESSLVVHAHSTARCRLWRILR